VVITVTVCFTLAYCENMTKSKKNKKRSVGDGSRQIIRGRFARYTTLSSGTIQFNSLGDIGSDSRLAQISDMFQLYRFRRLKITITEGSWGSGLTAGKYSTGYAMGLYLENPDSFPTTDHTKLLRERHSLWMDGSWAAGTATGGSGTQPPLQAGYAPRSLTVGPRHLIGDAPEKWWRTKVSTAGTPSSNLWQDIQWSLCFTAEDTSLGSGLQFTWWYDYEIEFCEPVDPSQTPAPVIPRLVGFSDEELRKAEEVLCNEKLRRLQLSASKTPDGSVGSPPSHL
jgi:hypothetical protein